MAINLRAKGISTTDATFQPMLENLQANILKSHARHNVRLLCIQFGVDDDAIKEWIRNFSRDRMKSTWDQLQDSQNRRAALANGGNGAVDGGLIANFFFTAEGYEELGFDASRFKHNNRIFVEGMKSRRAQNVLSDPPVGQWQAEYRENIDAMILLADDNEARINEVAEEVKTSLSGVATLLVEEIGIDLEDNIMPRGHEHFGYKDGISQPRYFIEDLQKADINTDTKRWDPVQRLDIILVKDPFTDEKDDNYGSFLVYRKLEQDVDGFNKKVIELGQHLTITQNQAQNNVSAAEYAGALAVGRFKDGTPIVMSEIKEGMNPAPNDFDYKELDPRAHKCPFHAHIRKVNPRGQGALVAERFITRRGIPYGRRGTNEKKGLLFMCFQSNIKRQFNFIQNAWSNAPGFPPFRGRPGIDPLIGQDHKGGQSWPKQYGSQDEVDFDFAGFIHMQGGEYFFAPSLGFLRNL